MIRLDPREEIRRLVDEEGFSEAEAMARVREDLRNRNTVQRVGPPKKRPMILQWSPEARRRGHRNSALNAGRPRKSAT